MDQGFDTTDCDRTDTRGLLQELEKLTRENAALRHELDTLKAGRAHGAPHRWVPPGARPHGGR